MLVFREGSNLKIQVATDTVPTNCPLPFADFETPHVCPVQDMTCTRCPCSPSCTYRPASHSRILQPELIGHAGLNFRAVKNIGDIGSKVAKSPFLCSKNIQSWTIPPPSSYKITSNIITPAKTTCALSDLFFLATHESIFLWAKNTAAPPPRQPQNHNLRLVRQQDAARLRFFWFVSCWACFLLGVSLSTRFTPWKINGWNLQIPHLERKMIFQTSMIMFHVNLPACSCLVFLFFLFWLVFDFLLVRFGSEFWGSQLLKQFDPPEKKNGEYRHEFKRLVTTATTTTTTTSQWPIKKGCNTETPTRFNPPDC